MGEEPVIMDACEMMPQVWVATEVSWVRAKDAKKIFGVGRGKWSAEALAWLAKSVTTECIII